MKKIFRRLACYSFLSIASIGCFDVEARLPRYQGELAVAILVEKIWTDFEHFINASYSKEQFIHDIVCMIYTNDGRQSLAQWMHERRPNVGVYGRGKTVLGNVTPSTPLYRLLKKFLPDTNDTIKFNRTLSMLMNLAFSCWTGTLTCYMHNEGQSLAKESLERGAVEGIGDIVVAACKWLLFQVELPRQLQSKLDKRKIDATKTIFTNNANLAKLIGVLFTLEIIDDWNQLKTIVGNPGLTEPTVLKKIDLVVPVPNTGYDNRSSHRYESDCHFSTLKNLLVVLCSHNYDAIKHKETAQYFVSTGVARSIIAEVIMGETSKRNHTKWFNALPENIKNSAEPSIYWLIYALKVLLTDYDRNFSTFQLELLKGYANEIIGIQQAICAIASDTADAVVEINPLQGAEVKPWRDHRMKITLSGRTIIQIDGTLTKGSHIEITDIRNTR